VSPQFLRQGEQVQLFPELSKSLLNLPCSMQGGLPGTILRQAIWRCLPENDAQKLHRGIHSRQKVTLVSLSETQDFWTWSIG